MKTTKKLPGRESSSTHEMRFQFGRVLQAVKAGRSLTLTYRNKPLARIVPLMPDDEIPAEDPVFRLHELAEALGPLTNAEMDEAIYVLHHARARNRAGAHDRRALSAFCVE